MKPERSSKIGWLTFGVSALVILMLGACQDAPTASQKNSTQIAAEITLTKERNAPDSLTWRTTGAAQTASLTGSGVKFNASISLPSPLGNGDSIWIQLWTAGMRTAELKYNQIAGTSTLKYAEVARLDSIALALLERLLLPAQRNHDTLLAVYAKALVDGDAAFKGFPKNCPTGIDTAAVIKVALAYALGKGSKLADLSATWLLAIDTITVHARVRALVVAGAAHASDTLGMFPPPPIRVMAPISVASSVQAGGNAVAVSGAFEWDKGLGLVAVNSYVIQGADTLKTVSVNGIPAIGSGDLAMSLTGNAQLMAGSAAPVGICSLVVVVRDGNGNLARSATSFEILKGVVVPQTPTIRLLSPVDGKVVPFDTASIIVKWIATALNSKIDTVQIGDQMGSQENDSVWSARVPLPATGKPTVVTARAHSIQNVWAVQSASFTRSVDQAGPTLTWVSPLADTIVESSTTSLVIRFKVQDPSGVDTILVNGQSPDSVSNAGVVWKTVALGASGGVTPVSVRVVDGAKNATVSVRSVTRKTDNSLVIYGLPDSVRVLEDSSATLSLQPNCPSGSVCKLKVANSDTTLLHTSLLGDTALRIVPKSDRNGFATVSVSIASGSKQTITLLEVDVRPINDAPTLSVIPSLLGSPTGISLFSNWLVSVSPGPADESTQRIAYQVTVDSGASLVNGTPFIDASGKLSLTAKGISGVARLAVIAVDNGDSTGLNRNHSAAQYIRVRLDAPPTLKVVDTLVGYEDQRTKSDTVHIDDLENSDGLTLDWTNLDSAILPNANLRVKAVPGGYSFDALSAKDSSGNVRIAWKLTDPVGNEIRDTSVIRFVPVNDAPVIGKAAGLPDTLVISCLTRDTTLPKLFGDIQWEPGATTQAGTFSITLVDTAQSHLFHIASGVDGILPLADGRLRVVLKTDTDVVVEVRIQAQDNGGIAAGGQDLATRSIWLHLTDTVLDADGNSYRFKRMPDWRVWMRSNLYTKPKNGDTVYRCAGADLWAVGGGTQLDPDCAKRGALYNWGTAMNQPLGCDTSMSCYQAIPVKPQGLCPKGWHVADREDWSLLMRSTYSVPAPGTGVDSTGNLRSNTHDWGSNYAGWFEFPGTGKFGDFIVPTDHPHGCQDRGAGSTNGTNFWLPHRPTGWTPAYPVPGGITFTLSMTSVRSEGICGVTDQGVASIRCVHDLN